MMRGTSARALLLLQLWIWLGGAELLSLTIGTAVAGGLGYGLFAFDSIKCRWFECCRAPYLRPHVAADLDRSLRHQLHGQHLAIETVTKAVNAHLNNPEPRKALVLSFHGPTGTGKNFVAALLRAAMFQKGSRSAFAHFFVATLHFTDPAASAHYQRQVRQWVTGNLTACPRQLFVFDEIDKLPSGVVEALRPFIDNTERVDDVDPRKSVYVFLSNAGSNAISKRAYDHYKKGLPRETLKTAHFEEDIRNSAYNEKTSGLRESDMVIRHLIDIFVPFLPLERQHVRQCVHDYMTERKLRITDDRIEQVLSELTFYPASQPIYSNSGCRPVATKVDILFGHELLHITHDHLSDEV